MAAARLEGDYDDEIIRERLKHQNLMAAYEHNPNPHVPENSYFQRKMENDFNHYLLGQIDKEPNRVSSFLNTDKFYNAVSRDHAISILDKPGVLRNI